MHTPEQMREDARRVRDLDLNDPLHVRLAADAEECARLKEGLDDLKKSWWKTYVNMGQEKRFELAVGYGTCHRQLTALLAETQPGGEPGEETGA